MLRQILSDYFVAIMLLLLGFFLLLIPVSFNECDITFVPDGCLPIDDVRIRTLVIIGSITALLGIIAIPICEILKRVKTLKPDKID